MSDILILSLPYAAQLEAGEPVAAPYWAIVRGGMLAASGSGDGWRGVGDFAVLRVVALASALDCPVQYWRFADLPPMQAATAGRLEVQRRLLGPAAAAHVVAAVPDVCGGEFAVAAVTQAAMAAWMRWLGGQGFAAQQVAAILPAAAILPDAGGALLGAQIGAEPVMRGGDHGYAADPALDAYWGGSAAATWLSAAERDAMLVMAAAHPVMDLRSGAWKVPAGRGWDAGALRWVKRLGLALLVVSALLFAVQTMRLAMDRDRADQAVMAAGEAVGVRASDAAGVEAEMDRQLSARGGGPLAFSVTASALYAVLADAPAVSVKSLAHRADGTLSASLAAPSAADLNPVLIALQAKGYRITAQPMVGRDGQQMANITIRAVP